MPQPPVYLAFDLGASSGRAMLGRTGADGQISLQEVHRFPNGPFLQKANGGVFWDIHGLFEAMLEGMRKVASSGIVPAAVGVDTWGVDFGLLDDQWELLESPRCYREPRNAGISRQIVARIGADRLQGRTGSMFQDHASLCQLSAAVRHTPELVKRAAHLLFIPDLLRHWLCGATDTDCTFASTSQMYDCARREWAADILAELGLPAHILPPVRTGPLVVGRLSERICRQTGLPAVPIVSGAGHDTGSAFGICLGGRDLVTGKPLPPLDDLVVISSGTWAILGVFVDAQLPPGSLNPADFGYEANPDGSLRIVRNLTGGWLIEQCRKAWSAAGIECGYEGLIAAARAAAGTSAASAIIDPQWEGFYHPPDMPAAIVEYCRQTGQSPPATPGQFAQVIFASLAATYAKAIDTLRAKTGRPLRHLYMMGGMARNAYLNELTAKAARIKVIVGPAEATALGNVLVQMAATCCS